MLTLPIILAAGSLSTLIAGAPIPSLHYFGRSAVQASSHSLLKRGYTVLGGTGTVSDGWPSESDWYPTLDDMFTANMDTLKSSCTQWSVDNNTDEEIDNIRSGVESVAKSTGVDARFIFAIIMQESNGCVRAPTTDNGVINPGLMQSHNGAGSCNKNGVVQSPCPASEITQMIQDGTGGTADGDGLLQCLSEAGGASDVSSYYKAARIYNSGSVDSSGNLGQGIATHCYSSDVANRLTGWATGASSCDSNTIGSVTDALGVFQANAGVEASDPTVTLVPVPATTTAAAPTTTTTTAVSAPTETAPAPVPTTTTTKAPAHAVTTTATVPTTTAPPTEPTAAPSATASTGAPIYPYAVSPCQEYYTVQAGDYCLSVEDKVGIAASQLLELNPGLDEACTNLWLGYQYCIKA